MCGHVDQSALAGSRGVVHAGEAALRDGELGVAVRVIAERVEV